MLVKYSKFLRFKFIGLMYLILISFFVLTVPEDWIRSLRNIRDFFKQIETKNLPPESRLFSDRVIKIIKKLEREAQKEGIVIDRLIQDLGNKSHTNQLLIKSGTGKELFSALLTLDSAIQKLPNSNSRKQLYYQLFHDDTAYLKSNASGSDWVINKFKDTPFDLALLLVEEYRLKAIALSQNTVQLKSKSYTKPELLLLTECSEMLVGDTAILNVFGDSIVKIQVDLNGSLKDNLTITQKQKIQFVPQYAGLHQITIEGVLKRETVSINVKPASFSTNPDENINICYLGLPYHQFLKIPASEKLLVQCSKDPSASYSSLKDTLSFVPKSLGWCSIKISNSKGLLFHDSVYVLDLPKPKVFLNRATGNVLSKSVFNSTALLNLVAVHPAFEKSPYQIKGYKVRKIGPRPEERLVSGDVLNNSLWNTRDSVSFLGISEIKIQAGATSFTFPDPFIITVN